MLDKRVRRPGWRLSLALVLGAAALGLAAWQAWDARETREARDGGEARAAGAPAAAVVLPAPSAVPAPPLAGSAPWLLAGAAPASAAAPAAAAPGPQGAFRSDAQGRLVHDQPLRLRVEELLALHEGAERAARLEAELAGLPAPAAARARELLARMDDYQAAQRAAFPPGVAPLVPEEGLAQLTTLQALRASHFGAEAARQLYAEDDAVARRLLELMRDETATSLSMADKAMRAQARFDAERGAAPR